MCTICTNGVPYNIVHTYTHCGTVWYPLRFSDFTIWHRRVDRLRRLVINKHYVLVIMQTGLLTLPYHIHILPLHSFHRICSVGKCWCGWVQNLIRFFFSTFFFFFFGFRTEKQLMRVHEQFIATPTTQKVNFHVQNFIIFSV